MPGDAKGDDKNDLADALVAGVQAAQAIRRAGRKKAISLVREAVHTTDRILGALAAF